MKVMNIPQRRKTDPLSALRQLSLLDPANADIVRAEVMYDQKIRQFVPDLEIFNPRFLVRYLEEHLNRKQRPGSTVSFYVVDFDEFKRYNDAYGHDAGDIALAHTASALSLSLDPRTGDFMGRWGGEEFIVVKRDLDFSLFERYGERLVNVVRNQQIALPQNLAKRFTGVHYKQGSDYKNVTISVGGSFYPLAQISDLREKADTRVRIAKQRGRNQFVGEGLEKRLE